MEYLSQKKEILERMARSLETENLADVKALIEELKLLVQKAVQKIGQM